MTCRTATPRVPGREPWAALRHAGRGFWVVAHAATGTAPDVRRGPFFRGEDQLTFNVNELVVPVLGTVTTNTVGPVAPAGTVNVTLA